jgi:hypothetical protein
LAAGILAGGGAPVDDAGLVVELVGIDIWLERSARSLPRTSSSRSATSCMLAGRPSGSISTHRMMSSLSIGGRAG